MDRYIFDLEAPGDTKIMQDLDVAKVSKWTGIDCLFTCSISSQELRCGCCNHTLQDVDIESQANALGAQLGRFCDVCSHCHSSSETLPIGRYDCMCSLWLDESFSTGEPCSMLGTRADF